MPRPSRSPHDRPPRSPRSTPTNETTPDRFVKRAGPAKPSLKGSRPRGLPGGIELIHEDDEVIVVDKPGGLITAGLPGQEVDSVFGFLKIYVKDQHRKRGTRIWIVHRLDKEASGLLVFAKTEKAYEFLKEEFRSKRAHRLYAAVVEGEVRGEQISRPSGSSSRRPEFEAPTGTVQSYLMEDEKGIVHSFKTPTDAARMHRSPSFRSSDAEGHGDHPKMAITHWRVMDTALGRSLLQVRLETGRKNQIRVHMQEMKHPIVGDRRYGAATDPVGRVCLHAAELAFAHPSNGQIIRFRSNIPGQFFSLIGRERGEAPPAVEFGGQTATPAAPTQEAPTPPPARQAHKDSDSWNHVAEWYTDLIEERKSDHHEMVILPGTTRLLAVNPGQRVLDIACGQGILCHRLASLKINAVGLDAAPRLIEAARTRATPNEQFFATDARTISTNTEIGADFDAAACVMALMNIDPLAPVLTGVVSKLKPGGRFVAVILHPAFRAPGQTSWAWDEPRFDRKGQDRGQNNDTPRHFRRVDGYLSSGISPIVMNPGAVARGDKPITTVTFHRPIQSYIKAFADAGLHIDALEEWASLRSSQPGPRAAEENRTRREIPMFLAIRGIKPTA